MSVVCLSSENALLESQLVHLQGDLVGSKTERRDYVHARLGSETPRTTTMSDSSLKPAAYRLVVCCCTRSLGRFAWLSWIWRFMHNNKQLISLSICRSWTKCSWLGWRFSLTSVQNNTSVCAQVDKELTPEFIIISFTTKTFIIWEKYQSLVKIHSCEFYLSIRSPFFNETPSFWETYDNF